MMTVKLTLVSLVLTLVTVSRGAQPTGCVYDDSVTSRGIYSCDFAIVSLPLTYSAFSNPIPQRIRLYDVNGELPVLSPSKTFDGFQNFATGSADKDYTNYLEIECTKGATNGQLLISEGTFLNMGYLQELRIKNCRLTNGLPEYVFSFISPIDALTIEGGSIAATAGNSFGNFDISKAETSYPRGVLNFTNVAITGDVFTSGFFIPVTSVETIILNNLGLTSLDLDMFSQNTRVKSLIMRDNSFTSIPNNMFDKLGALSFLDLTGMQITCSCDSLWFVNYTRYNNITLHNSLTCTDSHNQAKRVDTYFAENCVTYDICDGLVGYITGGVCYAAYDVAAFVLLVIAFFLALIALLLVCHTRCVLLSERDKLNAQMDKKWNKIQKVLQSAATGGQKPPAATIPPKSVNW